MIEIVLGLPGSGKTSSIVREMIKNVIGHTYYTNILPLRPKDTPQIVFLEKKMIVEEFINPRTEKSDLRVNVNFWQKVKKPVSVVLDEAHTILNARNSMSKQNKIINQWASLIRRVLGSGDGGYGKLVLITQRLMGIDCHLRDMATRVKYYKCHYLKYCKKCGFHYNDNNLNPAPIHRCPRCNDMLKKDEHKIECWEFKNAQDYQLFDEQGLNTFYRHYMIRDIENYWDYYDTEQWIGLTD